MEGQSPVLITRDEIQKKVCHLGKTISRDLEAASDLLVVGVLKGAIIFLSDLVREISVPLTLDFVATSSYASSTSSTGAVRLLKDLEENINGRDVLLVEDIVDTGLTLKYLQDMLLLREPSSLRTCSFLDKPMRRQVPVEVDYIGFTIPDVFVVGYGLDYNKKYRNLPFITTLEGAGEVHTKYTQTRRPL